MRDALRAFGAQLGHVLVPAVQRTVDALARLAEAFTYQAPQPSDPNPFPRIHLFRKESK
jgi:hypothetical protein